MKRLLLGDISEAERAQIEDRFLANDDFYQELLAAEDDLIDDYVHGELPEREHLIVERWDMTSRSRHEQIELARRLSSSASRKKTAEALAGEPGHSVSRRHSFFSRLFARRTVLSFAAAAVLLVIVVGGIWLLTKNLSPRPAQEEARTSQPPPTTPRDTPSPQIAEASPTPPLMEAKTTPTPVRETPRKPVSTVATFTLLPGMARGGSGNQLFLPAEVTEVYLRLGIEDATYNKYRATLTTPEGRKVWARDLQIGQTSTKSAFLTLNIPSAILKSGDYVLELGGLNPDGRWESVADYSFRVIKK